MLSWTDVMNLNKTDAKQHSGNSSALFERMMYVWGSTPLADPACIYFVPSSILDKCSISEEVSLILISDDSDLPMESHICATNYAVTCSKQAERIYEYLHNSFLMQDSYRKIVKDLAAMVNVGANLETMCKHFAQCISRPVGIVDNTLRFIATSSLEEVDQFIPEVDRSALGVKPELFVRLKKKGSIERQFASDSVIREEEGNLVMYTIPLQVGKVRAAILGICAYRGSDYDYLPQELIYELPAIAELFSMALSRKDIYLLNKAKYFPFIFSLLLEKGSTIQLSDIKERLSIFNYTLREQMYLISVKTTYKDGITRNVNALADNLCRVFSNAIYLIQQDSILFLVSRDRERSISNVEYDMWNSQLAVNGLHGGMTGPFTTFEKFSEHRIREANLALETGIRVESERALHFFEPLALDAMLYEASTKSDLSIFLFAPLMKLVQYDKLHETELTITLRRYLENRKQPTEVCSSLFIHKNTLYKRLAKIEQIMGCDIIDSDTNTLTQLQISYYIMDHFLQ